MSDLELRPLRRAEYRPFPFEIPAVELKFELALPKTTVTATYSFRRISQSNSRPLILNGERLSLVDLRLDGRPLSKDRYIQSAHDLILVDPPDAGELTIVTEILPTAAEMEGLLLLNGTLVTLCEPQGFRRLTYFPDRPDVMSRYRCTLVANRETWPTLLSNGHSVASENLPGGRHSICWEDPYPKASYLFALVAGQLESVEDNFETRSGRQVAISIHAISRDLPHCMEGLATLKRAMRWDEENYGCEYDLDSLNIAVLRGYPGGAMESKGLNVVTSEFFLPSAAIATDDEIRRARAVVAHEYFHNWTGNRVGSRSWFELSLKEGLTIFRQQQYMASVLGAGDARIDDLIRLREQQYPEDDGGTAHAVRPASYLAVGNLYTRTVYEKGAEIIRMLKLVIGDTFYASAIANFLKRYDGKPATIDDLLDQVESECGLDLAQFRRWYDVSGPVHLDVEGEYDPENRNYTLRFRQVNRSFLGPLAIPVKIELFSADTESQEQLLIVDSASTEFLFRNVPEPPVPAVLRGYSAPVRMKLDLNSESLALLAIRETDSFVRWDATRRLVNQAIWSDERAKTAWFEVVTYLLRSDDIDPAIVGRMLQLPSEKQIGQECAHRDIDEIRPARQRLARLTARSFEEALYDSYRALAIKADDPQNYGVRRLRNTCLWFLASLGGADYVADFWTQFQSAQVFENCWSAARVLVDRGGEDRISLLDQAYRRWRHHPSLLDHWFMIQAVTEADDCAEMVLGLQSHRDFELSDITRLKAIFDNFTDNQSAFHHRSGTGYDAVLNVVRALNGSSPRTAARFVKKFDGWRHLDGHRQALLVAKLNDLSGESGLSRDVRDILDRSLDRH